MEYYLELLHEWMSGEPCVLILDRFSAHESDATREKADELGIRLVFIPTSATDLYQPLDRRVFGALKSKGCKCFYDFAYEKNRGYTPSEAADVFVKCWYSLSIDLIHKAWNLSDVFEEEEENDESFEEKSEYEEEVDELENDDSEDSDDLLLIRSIRREDRARLTPPRH